MNKKSAQQLLEDYSRCPQQFFSITFEAFKPIIQALADGEIIQHKSGHPTDIWEDGIDFSFSDPVTCYRVKPNNPIVSIDNVRYVLNVDKAIANGYLKKV